MELNVRKGRGVKRTRHREDSEGERVKERVKGEHAMTLLQIPQGPQTGCRKTRNDNQHDRPPPPGPPNPPQCERVREEQEGEHREEA